MACKAVHTLWCVCLWCVVCVCVCVWCVRACVVCACVVWQGDQPSCVCKVRLSLERMNGMCDGDCKLNRSASGSESM